MTYIDQEPHSTAPDSDQDDEMGVAVEDPDDFNSGVDGLNDTGADRAINTWRGTAPNKDSQSTIIR